MDTLLSSITPDVLNTLLVSDDLEYEFINNSTYSTSTAIPLTKQTDKDKANINIINVAKLLQSYQQMNMSNIKDMLSD
jgi:hypothetical protein